MSDAPSLAPVHVPPDGGDTVFLVGDTYTTILSGAQTGGAFTLLEALVPPDTGPPPHAHQAEDETFVLLEGEMTFTVGDVTHAAAPGTTVFVPRGSVHTFSNVGTAPARRSRRTSPPSRPGST